MMGGRNKICLFAVLVVCTALIIFFYFEQPLPGGIIILPKLSIDCSCEIDCKSSIAAEGLKDGSADVKVRLTKPSSLMEKTRRHISETSRHQWLFMRSQIRILQGIAKSKAKNQQAEIKDTLKYMLEHGSEYSKVIDLEVKKLSRVDGWDEWRKKEDQELRKIFRERIEKLQNPQNCKEFPVLVCNLTNRFGLASGLHDVLWCFVNAYSSQRRLVLVTTHWHYAPDGWETLFRPVSETCRHSDQEELKKVSPWPGPNGSTVRTLLRSMPQDLGKRIIRLQGNPLAWWYGQFMGYLMRPNSQLQTFIDDNLKRIQFSKGIVGIHVRRTDKIGGEAASHELKEYMEEAEEYFQTLELVSMENVKRRVYIATDEPSVLKECTENYPQYDCLFNSQSAEMAFNMDTRYSNHSLWNFLADIFALSQTDFIVCTMSSGVGRLAYELKLAIDGDEVDVTDKVSSLDIPHYYAWTLQTPRKAIYNHKSKSKPEIPFLRGELFEEVGLLQTAIEGKVPDGFMRMKKTQTKSYIEGFVPLYKTAEIFILTNLTFK